MIAICIVDLPVPGPPVITDIRFESDNLTACFCFIDSSIDEEDEYNYQKEIQKLKNEDKKNEQIHIE